MKMSDVFELPVCVPVSTYDELADDFCRHIAEFAARRPAKAAAHAINRFDGLVNAVDVLLNHPELADRDAIAELLTRAKGGCDE